jgi:hypothetical protein
MLFSKGIGLGFNTQDFAAELRGIKPFATNKEVHHKEILSIFPRWPVSSR